MALPSRPRLRAVATLYMRCEIDPSPRRSVKLARFFGFPKARICSDKPVRRELQQSLIADAWRTIVKGAFAATFVNLLKLLESAGLEIEPESLRLTLFGDHLYAPGRMPVDVFRTQRGGL